MDEGEAYELYERISLNFFWKLPYNKLMKVGRMVSLVRRKKFKRNQLRKYGYSKAMSSDDVMRFFSCFKSHEHQYKVLFLLMAWLGLRIGEVIVSKKEHIDFGNKRFFVQSEKQRGEVTHSLFLHEKIFPVLMDYVNEYAEEIALSGGWLFPSKLSSSKSGHVSGLWVGKMFRRVCDRAGLSMVYGERESINGKPFIKAKLYLYTPHSLRHALGTYLASRNTKIELIQRILRHKSITSTMVYVKPSQDDVDYAFYKAFKDK